MANYYGCASGTDVPVAHLDYDYVRTCTKPKEVEDILRVLRRVRLARPQVV